MSTRLSALPLKATLLRSALLKAALPWLAFLVMFLWAWRTSPLAVPSYGDTLEMVWGTQYYARTLLHGASPLFMPGIFYPLGWHTITLAHTPALFLLALPFQLIGGAALAYNGMVLLSLALSFVGVMRLVNLRADHLVSTTLALVYTFAFYRWICASGGHMHFLWATSFLPWNILFLQQLRNEVSPTHRRRLILYAGLAWAGALYFSLYFVWIGVLPLLLLLLDGRQSLLQRLKDSAAITLIAVLVASPMLLLFYFGSRADQLSANDATVLLAWGASANSFITPPLIHPIPALQSLARTIFNGPASAINEVNESNWGILLPLLAAVGGVIGLRRSRSTGGLLVMLAVSVVLALGVALQWGGHTLHASLFAPLNDALWRLGHALKPTLFTSSAPPAAFADIVPLPDYLLTATLPFWESARVAARFSIVGGLALCVLSALALQRMPLLAKVALCGLLLVEMWPVPTQSRPLPTELHPAYTWLSKQNWAPGQSIIELDVTPIRQDATVLLSALDDAISTVSGAGSFTPQPISALGSLLGRSPQMLSRPDVAVMLAGFGVRYVVIHLKSGAGDTYEENQWQAAQVNPFMRAVRCFDPVPQNQVLPYPICIAELRVPPSFAFRVFREQGWSEFEPWGIWMLGHAAQATWIALRPVAQTLHLNAFPVCLPGTSQHATLYVNGVQLTTHVWSGCGSWDQTLTIPATLIHSGANTLRIEATVALQPGDSRIKNETRPLSIGFTALDVQPVAP